MINCYAQAHYWAYGNIHLSDNIGLFTSESCQGGFGSQALPVVKSTAFFWYWWDCYLNEVTMCEHITFFEQNVCEHTAVTEWHKRLTWQCIPVRLKNASQNSKYHRLRTVNGGMWWWSNSVSDIWSFFFRAGSWMYRISTLTNKNSWYVSDYITIPRPYRHHETVLGLLWML